MRIYSEFIYGVGLIVLSIIYVAALQFVSDDSYQKGLSEAVELKAENAILKNFIARECKRGKP